VVALGQYHWPTTVTIGTYRPLIVNGSPAPISPERQTDKSPEDRHFYITSYTLFFRVFQWCSQWYWIDTQLFQNHLKQDDHSTIGTVWFNFPRSIPSLRCSKSTRDLRPGWRKQKVVKKKKSRLWMNRWTSLKTELAKPKVSESPVDKNVIWLIHLTFLGCTASFGHIQTCNLTGLSVVNVVGNTFETFLTNWLNVEQICDCPSRPGKVCWMMEESTVNWELVIRFADLVIRQSHSWRLNWPTPSWIWLLRTRFNRERVTVGG
jgi:hypothetical protein